MRSHGGLMEDLLADMATIRTRKAQDPRYLRLVVWDSVRNHRIPEIETIEIHREAIQMYITLTETLCRDTTVQPVHRPFLTATLKTGEVLVFCADEVPGCWYLFHEDGACQRALRPDTAPVPCTRLETAHASVFYAACPQHVIVALIHIIVAFSLLPECDEQAWVMWGTLLHHALPADEESSRKDA